MMQDLYQEQLLEEARSPRNQGVLKDPDTTVVEFNASCGDRVELHIRLNDDKSRVQEVKWQGAGCIISQAGLSILSEKIKGASIEAIRQLEIDALLEWLGLETIAPGRIKCVMLGLSAVKRGLKDF